MWALQHGMEPSVPDSHELTTRTDENVWSTKLCIAVLVGFIALFCVIMPGSPKVPTRGKVKGTKQMLAAIAAALEKYKEAFGGYPPDTSDDPGSLPRYLGEDITTRDGKQHEPFLTFPQDTLKNNCVVDFWQTPIHFAATPFRVRHNKGRFDLYSFGPDCRTPADEPGNGDDDINNWSHQ